MACRRPSGVPCDLVDLGQDSQVVGSSGSPALRRAMKAPGPRRSAAGRRRCRPRARLRRAQAARSGDLPSAVRARISLSGASASAAWLVWSRNSARRRLDRQVVGVLQRLLGLGEPAAGPVVPRLGPVGSAGLVGLAHDRTALGQGQRRLGDAGPRLPGRPCSALSGWRVSTIEPDQVDPAVGVGLGGVDRLAEHGLGLVRAAVLGSSTWASHNAGLEIVGVGRDRLLRDLLGLAEVAIGDGELEAIRPRSPVSWPTAGIWL